MAQFGFLSSRLVRECHQQGDERLGRIGQIVDQLSDMFSSVTNALHARNRGLIGFAGTAIALGVDIAPSMECFLEPLLVCFSGPENRVRSFAAQCLYNIAKVSKGEVLVYFNPIFDALSKVSRASSSIHCLKPEFASSNILLPVPTLDLPLEWDQPRRWILDRKCQLCRKLSPLKQRCRQRW